MQVLLNTEFIRLHLESNYEIEADLKSIVDSISRSIDKSVSRFEHNIFTEFYNIDYEFVLDPHTRLEIVFMINEYVGYILEDVLGIEKIITFFAVATFSADLCIIEVQIR